MSHKCPLQIFLLNTEPDQGVHIIYDIHASLVSFNPCLLFGGDFMTLKFLKNPDQTACRASTNLYHNDSS